jgi:hypothetical protein
MRLFPIIYGNLKQLITLTRFIPKIGILSVPVKKTINLKRIFKIKLKTPKKTKTFT